MKFLSTQEDKKRMIFCIKFDLFASQAVQVDRNSDVMCLVYSDIDLLFCKSNMNKQIQKEDIHEHLFEQCLYCFYQSQALITACHM